MQEIQNPAGLKCEHIPAFQKRNSTNSNDNKGMEA